MIYWTVEEIGRRTFVRSLASIAGALAVGGCAGNSSRTGGVFGSDVAVARSPREWSDRMGLQLFTVRDQIEKDFEGTLAQVAAAGYKEVEPTSYVGRTPAQVRAALDRAGLAAPSTHVALVPGPELERQLAGYQEMGHRWAAARPAGALGGGRPPGPPPGATGGAGAPAQQAGRPAGGAGRGGPPQPVTLDMVKRQAELYNQVGAAGKPYGVKVLVHNHTNEFQPLADSTMLPYDVLFRETDPDLVAFELDIGWARVAGQDPLSLFAQHPHRFPLWHVKDMADLRTVTALPMQFERQRAAKIVPVGAGDIDYRPVFEHAADAGLEHFYIEQDTAPDTGSIEAMRLSAQNLRKSLS
ncbi:MAG: sugar phosphate isomerase/epimerase family protein [Gemmatimonadaceae bacterium]